ncbi:MAG: hypothetical protein NC320_04535 [Clostridium sp.]|nr:hypothetical protein [Clostridium sp.]
MKKYVCPHCGEATISPLKKAFAGNQKSKGVLCPNCGKRCTNGMQSAIFHSITDFIMLAAVVFLYIRLNLSFVPILAVIAIVFVINRLFDALFFPLVPSLRID